MDVVEKKIVENYYQNFSKPIFEIFEKTQTQDANKNFFVNFDEEDVAIETWQNDLYSDCFKKYLQKSN